MNDAQLIKDFVEHDSEPAFRSLVERHLDLVSGTARRITGDRALADEIAQTVFVLLARKARSLKSGTLLSGWLYRTTCFVANRALRSEHRRRRREQEAAIMQINNHSDPSWQTIVPELDQALTRLGKTDRNALLLRFFEQRSLRDVGAQLGLSEEAAKKRVTRALEKLRGKLGRGRTPIAVGVLAAGLSGEAAHAASTTGFVSQLTAAALSPAGAANSVLLTEVLNAWRWTKLKLALGLGSGLVATAAFLTHGIHHRDNRPVIAKTSSTVSATAPRSGAPTQTNTPAGTTTVSKEFAGMAMAVHPLKVTVLDAITGQPVVGARLKDSFMFPAEGKPRPAPLLTDSNGVATFSVPTPSASHPGLDRMSQFQVWIAAKDYAPREIVWLSSTGSVMNLVSNAYTVRIESGITLFGTVVNSAGQPVPKVRVTVQGNNYQGYSWSTDASGKITSPPVLRVEDFASVSGHPVVTDSRGQFHVPHFPSDLKALTIDLTGPHQERRKFCTPQGKRLSADDMAEIRFEDLETGQARLVLPRGITVRGKVVDSNNEPVVGATVNEGVQWGNLKILSRNRTDYDGRFCLSNRPPRQIILAASAVGYASASVVAQVKPGMKLVRIQLPPEMPLRGKVIDESGRPIAQANVQLSDLNTPGLGLQWSCQTDPDGRFVWDGAPTNQVALMISAPQIPAQRLVRLTASTNEYRIVLKPGRSDVVHVSGTVTDAATGKPIDHFTVKVCHDDSEGLPGRAAQTVEGVNGKFRLTTSKSEIPVGDYPTWLLAIEAKGYKPIATREYEFEEGDQHLDFQLQPGGTLRGVVRTPDGKSAAGCRLAIVSTFGHALSYQPGSFFLIPPAQGAGIHPTFSDSRGRFALSEPLHAKTLVAFDDSGWATATVPTGNNEVEIQLKPWARVEGEVLTGRTPVAGEQVMITELVDDPANPISLVRTINTGPTGHFIFKQLPAGEYQISLTPAAWQKAGQPTVKTLQTAVALSAGETQQVQLGGSGRLVTAKLEAPVSVAVANWQDARAILRRDAPVPPRPVRSDFISDAAHTAALERYAHDPKVLKALVQARDYLGTVSADGTLAFENVPPGRYLLEVTLLDSKDSTNSSARAADNQKTIGKLRVPVSVPAEDNAEKWPVALGEFKLESL